MKKDEKQEQERIIQDKEEENEQEKRSFQLNNLIEHSMKLKKLQANKVKRKVKEIEEDYIPPENLFDWRARGEM